MSIAKIGAIAGFVAAALGGWGCSADKKEPDCVPAPQAESAAKEKIVSTPLYIDPNEGKRNNDWCRACVMGPKGFASCQRVFGDTADEPRDKVRERARLKACVDSGFGEKECPSSATVGIVCKGDPPPQGTVDPGTAVRELYRNLNPEKFEEKGSATTAPGADKPGSPATVPAKPEAKTEAKPGTVPVD